MSRPITLFHLFFLIFLCTGCDFDKPVNVLHKPDNETEKINQLHDEAEDQNNSLDTRIQHINLAYQLASKQQVDSLKIKVLMMKTRIHGAANQNDSSLFYARKLLTLCKKSNDSLPLAQAYNKLGMYQERAMSLDSAYYYYNESKKIYEVMADSLSVAKKLLNMAILLNYAGSYQESDQLSVEGLSLLVNSVDRRVRASLYNNMAINAKKQQDFEEAVYWYNKAIETTDNKQFQNIYLTNMANIYREKGDYDKAIDLYSKLLKDPEIRQNTRHIARLTDNLAYSKWLLHGDRTSLEGLSLALDMRIRDKNLLGQITSHEHLSDFYSQNDPAASRQHLEKMYELAKEVNSAQDRLIALKKLLVLNADNPALYVKYSKTLIRLRDSVQRARDHLSNKFARIRYDSETVRSNNEMLRLRATQRMLALERAKGLNTFYVSAGIISLMAFISLFVYFRSRHQKEKLQEIYHTENRISKKVHDEVANDLYRIMTRLGNEIQDGEHIIDDIEVVYEKTRNISREYNTLDLDQDFSELLSDLLISYRSKDTNVITKGLKTINWNRISPVEKTTIYRVLQELLTNMKKHSGASVVIIGFEEQKGKLKIKYRDDGVGCELLKKGGLKNVENRIHNIGGSLTLSTEMNKGFKATIIV